MKYNKQELKILNCLSRLDTLFKEYKDKRIILWHQTDSGLHVISVEKYLKIDEGDYNESLKSYDNIPIDSGV